MAVVFELLIFLVVGLVLLTLCGIALNTILEMAKKLGLYRKVWDSNKIEK